MLSGKYDIFQGQNNLKTFSLAAILMNERNLTRKKGE